MKTLVIYPGSFKPFHVGHLNITEKIENIFGKESLIIAVGINPAKVKPEEVGDIYERSFELSKRIGRKVEVYTTFLHEFVEEKEKMGYNVIIARGLRNGDDLSYENNQIKFIEDFKRDIKTIFIMCDKEYEHISSTSLRQLESFKPGSSSKYLC